MQNRPVYIDGEKCGSLEVYAEGLMTVMSAKCSADPGKVVRLYLFGEGQSALLGTMRPEGGSLRVVRRFSRAELKKLPENIEYAADRALCERKCADTECADTVWRRGKMGCLVSDKLIAIPADAHRLGRVCDKLRYIEGQAYLIFERNL